MKTTTILSTLALALPAFAAPAPAASPIRDSVPCPNAQGKVLTSNNGLGYKIECGKTLSTKVLRVWESSSGQQECMTACDGTSYCTAFTFEPSSKDQMKGKCSMRTNGKQTKAEGIQVGYQVSGQPTTTITTWPTITYPAATSAKSSSAPATTPTGSFGGVAIHSGSNIQYASVNAAGTNFYLLKDSVTYCPDNIECSNTTITQFRGGADTLSLDTVVPGGQQVYVDNKGALRFTQPHSASTGQGSSVTGFSVVDSGLHLRYNGDGFVACKADGSAYEVYVAGASGAGSKDCLGFEFRVAQSSAPAAWEYA